jgi:hypothetical protein
MERCNHPSPDTRLLQESLPAPVIGTAPILNKLQTMGANRRTSGTILFGSLLAGEIVVIGGLCRHDEENGPW